MRVQVYIGEVDEYFTLVHEGNGAVYPCKGDSGFFAGDGRVLIFATWWRQVVPEPVEGFTWPRKGRYEFLRVSHKKEGDDL
ncbi:MAG TPA: hypothetical protein VJA27_03695 [Patescibacteria group bacterium]|nr:hypothetical protein [Patescibacteria group bacterium]